MSVSVRGADLFLLVLGLAGEQDSVDVGENTTGGDDNVGQELVELLVVADGQLDVAGDDADLLVVARSVTSELENFGSEVLEDGSEVDRGASSDTLSESALTEVTVDTSDGELETSTERAGVGISLALGSSTTSLLAGGLLSDSLSSFLRMSGLR